jgi:hypothetical protein
LLCQGSSDNEIGGVSRGIGPDCSPPKGTASRTESLASRDAGLFLGPAVDSALQQREWFARSIALAGLVSS